MGSLTAHLLEPGDHGRLRFHPSCPVCRQERLHGSLSSEPVVSRRAQALLAGGVLALSASAPAVSIAQEADQQFEGVAAPETPGGAELDDPTFDPGGDTALSFDTAPAPAAPDDGEDSGEGAPLDVEPTVDLDARVAPLAEPDPGMGEEQSAVPPAEALPPESAVPPSDAMPGGAIPPGEPAQPVAPAPPAEPTVGADGDASAGQESVQLDERRTYGQATHLPTRARYTHGDARSDAGAPDTVPADSASVPETDADTSPSSTDPDPLPVAAEQAPPQNSRASYVVQPGDSLWSIARRLLGRDASVGDIAREVNRLWSLNRAQIATGDPNLLMVGTRLELR
jgi:nucleoid-associated protein YgaU